jgi:hypothetical protein
MMGRHKTAKPRERARSQGFRSVLNRVSRPQEVHLLCIPIYFFPPHTSTEKPARKTVTPCNSKTIECCCVCVPWRAVTWPALI